MGLSELFAGNSCPQWLEMMLMRVQLWAKINELNLAKTIWGELPFVKKRNECNLKYTSTHPTNTLPQTVLGLGGISWWIAGITDCVHVKQCHYCCVCRPFQYWRSGQPDNNGGHPSLGQEDCAHIIYGGEGNNWNDLSCKTNMRWICEKMV